MSLATLLVMPTDDIGLTTFAFEHAMAHRLLLGAMYPLTRFSVLPYLLDPMLNAPPWRLDHQQAQDDFITTMPTWGSVPGDPTPPFPGELPVAVPVPLGQNLLDSFLDDAWQRQWWTFANNQEHMIAAAALPAYLIYPFW